MPKGKAPVRVFAAAHSQDLPYSIVKLVDLIKQNHLIPSDKRLKELEGKISRERSFYWSILDQHLVTNTERENSLRRLKYAAKKLLSAVLSKEGTFLYPALKLFQQSYLSLDYTARGSLYSIFTDPAEVSAFLIRFDLIAIKYNTEKTIEVITKIATLSIAGMAVKGHNYRDPNLARLLCAVAPIFQEVTGRSIRIGYDPYSEDRPYHFGDWIRDLLARTEISDRSIENIIKINDL